MLFGEEHVKRYQARTAPLIYRPYGTGERYVVVASKGGAPDHPDWYLNLRADPKVRVQIEGDRFTATARDATPEERPELWGMMAEVWPDYDEYQKQTDREIPVVVLERD
jgi:deazaflavin-dependent oxidoreductase (nitroreductase family)